ncbi:Cytochrome P450 84A1 [Spatholobus suberectus]|nr:Cytochrome P450 84A1 [Spatholobus suberectus]
MDLLLELKTLVEPFRTTRLLIIIPVTLLLCLVSRIRRKTAPYPPGPKGLPIIGNMNMMEQLTHRGLANLAKQYGGVFHLRMGFLHMVTISNAEAARQVLQVHDNVFSNRPATVAISYLTYERADMAFAHYGPFWRQMRKICVMKLFSRKRAESWNSVRDEVDTVVRSVEANLGSAVNVGELRLQPHEKHHLSRGFRVQLPGGAGRGLNSRLVKARAALDGFIDKIIDEHVQKKRRGDSCDEESDMVDELLNFYSEEAKLNNESDDLQNSIRLTKDNIKAIIMDVMFGGTETVASGIEWAMAELMRSPEDLRRVQQELADVVGLDRRVEESDLEKLVYLKCAVKETLRLHPPIPLLLHETAEDAAVCGYFVPKGSRVMINAWAIGRDKDSWEDPEKFKPSRFLNPGVPDFKGNNFEFIPFGSGRRSCPGMQLGLYTLELAVAHLLHCFTWELPDGMKPSELDMSDVFGLTAPMASRLVAVPSKRVLCPL